jgi:large subunit ribosomal protein L17
MRHGNKVNHLGRTTGHRIALLRNLSCALIQNKRITTTLAKAKELRIFVEPLITKAKENTTHNHRMVFSALQNKEAVKSMFGEIRDKVGDRPGGYTRILRTGFRKGDAAETCFIELVDFNEAMLPNGGAAADTNKKRTRRSRGGAKTATATDMSVETAEAPEAEA